MCLASLHSQLFFACCTTWYYNMRKKAGSGDWERGTRLRWACFCGCCYWHCMDKLGCKSVQTNAALYGGGRHHTSLKTFCPPLIGDFKVPIFETVAFKITATQYLHSTSKQISSRLCIPYMIIYLDHQRGVLVTQSVSVGIASWPNVSAKTP